MPGPVVVIADLIADLAMHIPAFPVRATDLTGVSYLQLGPGGACNTAIMAARLGLPVMCLGELGYDAFGEAVLEGLQGEGIDCGQIVVSPAVRTPVAGVIVDGGGEPAYLGYRGELRIRSLTPEWRDEIRAACALFADGWAENEGVANLVLEAFREAAAAGIPTFFDPGPGNPAVNNGWHGEVVRLAHVVLANEKEAIALTGATRCARRGAGIHRGRCEAGGREARRCGLSARNKGEIRDCAGLSGAGRGRDGRGRQPGRGDHFWPPPRAVAGTSRRAGERNRGGESAEARDRARMYRRDLKCRPSSYDLGRTPKS